jgi:hypothetical protein
MDVIHPQREPERWTETNDLFLQQTITKKWNTLRFTKRVRCWCKQKNQFTVLKKEVKLLVFLSSFFLVWRKLYKTY